MVFKKDDEIIVTCDCGCCEALNIKKKFNLIWVSAMSGDFYTSQFPLTGGIRHIYRDLENRKRNKGRLFVSEVVMKEQDVLDLIYALEDLISDMDDSKLEEEDLLHLKETDRSMLHMSNICFDDEDMSPEWREYSIELESHLSLKDILFHNHRQYDESYSRAEIELFIKKAKKMLKRQFEKELKKGKPFLMEGETFKNTKIEKLVSTSSENIAIFRCELLDTNTKMILREEEILKREGLL